MLEGLEIHQLDCLPFVAKSDTQYGALIKDAFLLFLSEKMSKILNKGTNFSVTTCRKILRHLFWVKDSEQAVRFLLKISKPWHQIRQHL